MRQEQIVLGALLVELATSFPYLLHYSYLVVLKISLLCGLQQFLLGLHITPFCLLRCKKYKENGGSDNESTLAPYVNYTC